MVDYIILNDVTGDAYEYGMMVSTTTSETTGGDLITNDDGTPKLDSNGNKQYTPVVTSHSTIWKLVRGGGADIEFTSSAGYSGRSGDMVGVVPGKPMSDQATGSTIKAIVQLTEIKNVKPSDFFESEGAPHVTVAGRTYRIANDVECYRDLGGIRYGGSRPTSVSWLTGETGEERLNAIRAYSDDLTIYVDPVGNQVRVIKGN
jgi:hypothetical protein